MEKILKIRYTKTYKITDYEDAWGYRTRREQLFLCIGGPKGGDYLANSDLPEGYIRFNNSVYNRPHWSSNANTRHTAIFVWHNLLKEKN